MIYWCIQWLLVLRAVKPGDKVEFKLTLDGRPFASKNQVLVGLVCTSDLATVQSATYVYPICIISGKESIEMFNEALTDVTDARSGITLISFAILIFTDVAKGGIEVDGNRFDISFIGK